MNSPLDDFIAASAPRDVPSLVNSFPASHAGGASFYDGESISLPVTGGDSCSIYSIIVLERPEDICGGQLRHNETACIRPRLTCTSSHRGEGRLALSKEAVIAVVSRNKETIFSVPLLTASFVDESLINHWLEEKKTKLEWNKSFDVVRYLFTDPNKPVTVDQYLRQIDTQLKAKVALKTPAKCRKELFNTLDKTDEEEIVFAPYLKLEPSNQTDDVEAWLDRMERYIVQEAESGEERWASLKEVLQDNASTSKFHTTQINAIDTMVGVRNPRTFPQEFDGTDLWSTVGAIGRSVITDSKKDTDNLEDQIYERCSRSIAQKYTGIEQFNKFVNHLTNWFESYHQDKSTIWNKLNILEAKGNGSAQGHFFNQFQGVHSSFMHQPTHNESNKVAGPTLRNTGI